MIFACLREGRPFDPGRFVMVLWKWLVRWAGSSGSLIQAVHGQVYVDQDRRGLEGLYDARDLHGDLATWAW